MATEITREQWLEETERLCPSDQAYDAYVAVEEDIVENTDLDVSYLSVSRGKSDYCTFSAFAGKFAVTQMYKGQCQLNWRWKGKMPGLTEEKEEEVVAAFDEFRTSLGGKEGKGWETVKVLRLGEEKVKEAVVKLAAVLVDAVSSCTADAK